MDLACLLFQYNLQREERGGRGRGRVGRKERKRIKWVLVVVVAVRPLSQMH